MPKKENSPTALKLLAILNNINELIVLSNDRQSARDVMKAFRVYASDKGFDISEDKIENFLAILIDSRPYTLSYLIQEIAKDVIAHDRNLDR